MRKLIVSEFVTLDGVIQAPGGKDEDRDGGFEHGGWTMPYWHDDIGKSFGAMPGNNILTDGSSQLVHALLVNDLVDELHLLVSPLVLGSGKRLWPGGVDRAFALRSTTPYPSGVVGLDYVRERP